MSASARTVRLTIATALIAVLFVVWPAAWRGRDGEASRAAEWATYYGSALPTRLASVRAYPISYQMAVYRALPAEGRLGIWREYLGELARRGDVPAAGREALGHLSAELTKEDFVVGASDRVGLKLALASAEAGLGSQASLVAPGAWQHLGTLNPRSIGLGEAIRATRARVVEAVAGQKGLSPPDAVVYAEDPPDCTCWVPENGQYNCAERQGYTKYCLPQGPPPYFCKLINDQYSGPCSWTQTRPCNGWCAWEPNSSLCGSCDDSPSCCDNCFGTWDPNLQNCNTGSPLIVKLSRRESYALTSVEDGVLFDISARGTVSRVSWTPAGSDLGFIVLDKNGNGIIDDGGELFGTETVMRNGKRAPNGFVALYDLDGGFAVTDMKIDAADVAYSQLRVWVDDNHNGFSETAELMTLRQAGIVSLPVEYRETPRADRHGNRYKYVGSAVFSERGRVVARRMFDVFFAVAND
jgi:hypothetical protein